MTGKREQILDVYETALEEEGARHNEALKSAKEACLQALRAERQGRKREEIVI